MFDNQDLLIFYDLVLKNKREANYLKKKFKLTDRQLLYVIDKINAYLLENTCKEIILKGNVFIIDKNSEKYIQTYLLKSNIFDQVYHSKKYRQVMIILLLSCNLDYLSLDHLKVMLNCSRSTVLNDLKQVKILLSEKNVSVFYNREFGYFLSGNEMDIRYLVMKMIITILNEDNGTLFLEHFIEKDLGIDSYLYRNKIVSISEELDLEFYENNFKEFFYSFLFLMNRFKEISLEENWTNIDKNSVEYRFSENIGKCFDLKECNINYIAAWILGLSVGNIDMVTNDRNAIKQLLEGLVLRFETLGGVKFSNNEEAIKQLYKHFRPSYYRIYYNLPIVNPLTKLIKEEYANIFFLVEESLTPLQNILNKKLSEDEVAFLTMHFISLTYEKKEKDNIKAHCLIVCPSGVGTSLILLKELETLFPNVGFTNLNIKDKINIALFDFVITTTINSEILKLGKPFIVVNPIMTYNEKFELMLRVTELLKEITIIDTQIASVLKVVKKHVTDVQFELIQKEVYFKTNSFQNQIILEERSEYPLLSEITSKKLIQLNVEANNWEQAIRNCTEVLVTEGKVLPSYIDGMVSTTKETGPYIVITKHVALPHARPELGAKELAISISTLKNPVKFGNKDNDPVKYIFGLSALDNQTHLTAMAELAELLDDTNFYKVLDTAKDRSEILDYIKEFERRKKS